MLPTLDNLSKQLEIGQTSATVLLDETLAKLQGLPEKSLFTLLTEELAYKQAREVDRLRAAGTPQSPWAGIPITVKDLFDLDGMVTTAGSRALATAPAAKQTAPAIQRLINAGFVIVGRVNMTEFAYSGLGLNPHYSTPVNPYSHSSPRIPGGSSSGGAVSVASDLVCATIGTDTGGSVRIPSAFCNLVGFKPGSSSVPGAGLIPLAETLDSVGPLTNSVACCAVLHGLMANEPLAWQNLSEKVDLNNLKVLVPRTAEVWRETDKDVVERCDKALAAMAEQGVTLVEQETPLFDDILESGVQGVIAGYESARWHSSLISQSRDLYDPRVASRIEQGALIASDTYETALDVRRSLIARFDELMQSFDAVCWPTTACTAPAFTDVEDDSDYGRLNLKVLRNTAVGNVIDSSAVSLPLSIVEGQSARYLPAGLMLLQTSDNANNLLRLAQGVEKIVRDA